MTENARQQIKTIISNTVLRKIREDFSSKEHKPFFTAIFSEKDIIVASTLQSIYTSFGMSIYEKIGKILAEDSGYEAITQYSLLGKIDRDTENLINDYWSNLKTNLKTNTPFKKLSKNEEVKFIFNSIKPGFNSIDGDSTVDLFIKKPDGNEYYFDITTVKNNLKSFEVLKLKLLRWCALRLSTDKSIKVHTYIAIPYNPYFPSNYMEGTWNNKIIDSDDDIMIQDDFWNFLGNSPNTYKELLSIFIEVGDEVKDEIENMFSKY